jgi:hypothetical protein
MKGIFISQAVMNKNNGGGQFVRSLICLLESVIGKNNLKIVSLPDEFYKGGYNNSLDSNLIGFDEFPSTFKKLRNLSKGCPRYVSPEIFDKVFTIINEGDYDFVFLGFSTYRYLIEKVKRNTKLPVFVMYQGITPNTKLSRIANAGLLQKVKFYTSYKMVLPREKVNAQLADCNIVHNKRERDVFYHYYKKEPNLLLPVFIADKFSDNKGKNPGMNGFSLLFVGSNFGPNISGLKWFVENVMDRVSKDVHLYVVGQGMEVLRSEVMYQRKNVSIIGEVEKLEPWYYHANLVVEPIFEGDGMKTKTVEAMMFGKTILGSDEAFCGYVGLEKYLCNTADEFVEQIENYRINGSERINDEIRSIYLEHYSEQAIRDIMRKAIDDYVKSK